MFHFNRPLFPCFLALVFLISLNTSAQKDPVTHIDSLDAQFLNWHNLDFETDQVLGVSVTKAYDEILKKKTPQKKVIVAVIDGGVDIDHKDLKGKIWVNEDEIPGNGIDDDNNGYVDDVHGWSFLGNKDGENIEYENTEETRVVAQYQEEFKNISSINDLPENKQKAYTMYLSALNKYNSDLNKHQNMHENLKAFEEYMVHCENLVRESMAKDTFIVADLEKVEITNDELAKAVSFLKKRYAQGFSYDLLNEMKKHANKYLEKHLNMDFQPRTIIADDPQDIEDTDYGNNDIKGPDPFHGTFVSGLITANRNNDYGIDGIAENVEIMVLRAVPHGDERDKDVALAIRYAVKNGANIINMSFGKNISPQKNFVDEAIKLADENNVLLVHAAGNAAENLDKVERFPSNTYADGSKVSAWMNVGASAKNLDRKMCGVFSNYGKENVDLFAPGVNVISLYPENQFQLSDGTSYACPVVVGVAALVWSYYPDLTSSELKDILLASVNAFPTHRVYMPNITTNKKKKRKFKKLSRTAGIVNAYQALKLAEQKQNAPLALEKK